MKQRPRTSLLDPGKNSLAKGEIVASFLLPPRPARAGDAYLRFIPRTEMDIAVVGAGINLMLDDKGVCTQRACVSVPSPTVHCWCRTAADALIGTTVDAAAIDAWALRSAPPETYRRQTRNERIPH